MAILRRAAGVLGLATVLALGGCTVGDLDGLGGGDDDDGSGDGGDPDDPTPELSVTVTGSSTMTLGTSSELTVEVTSVDYAGTVELAATGVPASWQVAFAPSATLTVADGDSVTATLTVTAPSDGEAMTATVGVDATSSVGVDQASTSVTVENLYLIPIAAGSGEGPHGFPDEVALRVNTMVRFVNYDGTVHTIHTDSDPRTGFGHSGPMDLSPGGGMPGGTFDSVPNTAGVYSYYCHDHGLSGPGLFTVQ